MPISNSTPSMETSIASTLPPLALHLAISSQSPIITAAKPGLKINVLNAHKDGTSTKKESAAKSPNSAASSTELKESVKPAIKAIPSLITAASSLIKT